jgi:hypothetical protein
MKKCSKCLIEKPINEFYSSEKINAKGEKYLYYLAECKDCTIARSSKTQKNNPKKYNQIKLNYYYTDHGRKMNRNQARKYRESGGMLNWQRTEYGRICLKRSRDKRKEKKHDISLKEWYWCLSYFNNSCAYCGLTWEEHMVLYGEDLHKEHIIHDGRNDIKNCVPACKVCNSEKSERSLNNWYNDKNNKKYRRIFYLKIYTWLRYDVQKFIEKKKRNNQMICRREQT